MARPNEIELIISARRDAQRVIEDLTTSIQEIQEAAQERGLASLFSGFDNSADKVRRKLQQVNEELLNAKAAQKAINTASKFNKSLEEQDAAIDKTRTKLSLLESSYEQFEEAANKARLAPERLTQALEKNQQRQQQIVQTLAQKNQELAAAQQELSANGGLDQRASQAIAEQRKKVLDAGIAWRELTKQIRDAKLALSGLQQTKEINITAKQEGEQRLQSLKEELIQLKELNAQIEKQKKTSGIGAATQLLGQQAKQRIKEIQDLIKAERQAQAQLANDITAGTAAIRRQENAIGSLAEKSTKQKQAYDNLRNSLSAVNQELISQGENRQQRAIQQITDQVQTLQQQLTGATERATELNRQIAERTTPDPRAIRQFQELRETIGATQLELSNQTEELNRLQQEYNSAGVSAQDLANEQARLNTITASLEQQQSQLNSQLNEVNRTTSNTGSGVNSLVDSFVSLGSDSRQSLGFLQRIRGELLSIAATYTGVFAVVDALKSIYDIGVLQDKAKSRFTVFFGGDADKARKEIEFVRNESDRLGISFEVALDQYSKFVSGLTESTPLEQARKIFTGFSTAASVAKLDEEELKRIFTAVTQIFGKQQVQLEELKGQLADALPGAIEKTAKALKLTVPELTKMVEQGRVGQEAAILLAAELEKAYGSGLTNALKGPQAQVNLFKNAVVDLKDEVGKSGFLIELAAGLKEITKAIKSDEFKQGAKEIANALIGVVKVGVTLIQNFQDIKYWLEILLRLFIAQKIIAFTSSLNAAGVAMITLATNTAALNGILRVTIGLTGAAVAALSKLAGAFAVGYLIGDWLQENYIEAKQEGVKILGELDYIFTTITAMVKAFKIILTPGSLTLNIKDTIEQLYELRKKTATEYDIITNVTQGMLDDLQKQIDDKNLKVLDSKDTKIEVDKIKTIITDLNNYTQQTFSGTKSVFPFSSEKAKEDADKQKSEGFRFYKTDQGGLNLDELRKKAIREPENKEQLKKLVDDIKEALAAIDKEIQAKSADTLQERIDTIAKEYDKLLKKISEAGGLAAFPGAKQSIEQITAIRQVEEIEKEINKLISERKELSDAIYQKAELGAISFEEANKRINIENARILPALDEALKKAKEISTTINSKPVSQSISNQEEIVSLEKIKVSKEEISRLDDKINEALSIRSEKIQTISAQQSTGAITEYEAQQRVFDLNYQTNEQQRQNLNLLEQIITANKEIAESTYGQETLERIKQTRVELGNVSKKIIEAQAVNEQFASGFTNAFEEFIDGTKSAKDAFKSFIADFLRQIAKAILQALVLKAIQSTGFGGLVSGAAGVAHTGGIAGNFKSYRRVDPSLFAGAMRYHTGGIAGLRPGEVPAILKAGEEILPKTDPRHVMNAGQSQAPAPQNIEVINTIDMDSLMQKMTTSSSFKKQIVNIIRADSSSVKTALGD